MRKCFSEHCCTLKYIGYQAVGKCTTSTLIMCKQNGTPFYEIFNSFSFEMDTHAKAWMNKCFFLNDKWKFMHLLIIQKSLFTYLWFQLNVWVCIQTEWHLFGHLFNGEYGIGMCACWLYLSLNLFRWSISHANGIIVYLYTVVDRKVQLKDFQKLIENSCKVFQIHKQQKYHSVQFYYIWFFLIRLEINFIEITIDCSIVNESNIPNVFNKFRSTSNRKLWLSNLCLVYDSWAM